MIKLLCRSIFSSLQNIDFCLSCRNQRCLVFFSIENIHMNKFCSEINFLRRALCCRCAAPAPLGQQGQLPLLSGLGLSGPGLSGPWMIQGLLSGAGLSGLGLIGPRLI